MEEVKFSRLVYNIILLNNIEKNPTNFIVDRILMSSNELHKRYNTKYLK